MNRAILIVICDFIVSAMLSLFTGTSVSSHAGTQGAALDHRTAVLVLSELRRESAELAKQRQELLDAQYQQGYAGDRQQRLTELTERLAEVTAKADILERKQALTKEETGALTPDQLQKQLEREITARYRLHLRKEDADREVRELRKRNLETARNLAQLDRTYRSLREEDAAHRSQIDMLRQQGKERDRELREAGTALTQSREVIAARTAELQKSRSDLRQLELFSTTQASKRQAAETALAFTRGKLNATEQELAETQSRSDRMTKRLAARDLELKETQRQLEDVKRMLKTAVTNLSEARADLAKTRETSIQNTKALAKTSGELAATRSMLKDARSKLTSDVQKQYSSAVVRLEMKMQETRMLIPVDRQQTFYLPAVQVGDRVCVIGELPELTGGVRMRPDYSAMKLLKYSVRPAEGKAPAQPVAGPLYALKDEPSVAMLEVNVPGRIPLKTLSVAALKQRGVQDLYLFKSSALGKDSATLGGRCSLGTRYFYIRNAARGTGSELRAEPGDFVLTRQGEFVALVVDVVTSDLGRRQMARCVMIPDQIDWQSSFASLPLNGPGAMARFNTAAVPLLRAIREATQQEAGAR